MYFYEAIKCAKELSGETPQRGVTQVSFLKELPDIKLKFSLNNRSGKKEHNGEVITCTSRKYSDVEGQRKRARSYELQELRFIET